MRALWFALALLLAACASRPSIAPHPELAPAASTRMVFYATTRAPGEPDELYGNRRSSRIRYGQIEVSVPPDRKPGEILTASAGRRPDPSRDFFALDSRDFAGADDLRRSLAAELSRRHGRAKEVAVYVHGFNNTFPEAVFRLGQLGNDVNGPAVSFLYSWPSRGSPLGYVYDRDSVLFARDGLEETLGLVVAAGADRIILVGHSLGTELLMETLRQMAIGGNRKVVSRIGGVILISPDIDTQLFRRQAKRIGKLPQPFLIFTSGRDKALALSAALSGRSDRLGNIQDLDKLAELDVTVIDVTAYSEGEGHFTVGNSPTVLSILAGLRQAMPGLMDGPASRSWGLPGLMRTFQSTTQYILRRPAQHGG
ncbi:MAG: alpha/beta hydrolase [Paracoccaceae bacterium]